MSAALGARAWWALCLAGLLAGCGRAGDGMAEEGEEAQLGVERSPLTWNGKQWKPEAWVLAAGDQQVVTSNPYPAAGNHCTSTNPWACSCGAHPACSSGLPGTLAFASFLKKKFPQISSIGGTGSCCRQSTGSLQYLSAHSIGRALDLMIPETSPGDADNARGDPIAAWLIANAQSVGVQYVAWDMAQWAASAQPGKRYGPFASSVSHTNHLHLDLNVAAANRQTPFFTSGAISGGGCDAGCAGDLVVQLDCHTRDCAAKAATCTPEPLPRCKVETCPPGDAGTVCADEDTLLRCYGGLVAATVECGAPGYCSTAGVGPDEARCISALCVDSPDEVPEAHVQCSTTRGRRLDCRADGGAVELPCDGGQVCALVDGVGSCVPPLPECPVPDAGQQDDRFVCLDGGLLARCVNGNLYGVTGCGEGRSCAAQGGVAHCAHEGCLAAAPARSFCTAEGAVATCDGEAVLLSEDGCPGAEACALDGGAATCVVPAQKRAGDGGATVPPPPRMGGCGCGGAPVGGIFQGVLVAAALAASRRRHPRG